MRDMIERPLRYLVHAFLSCREMLFLRIRMIQLNPAGISLQQTHRA